jgi:hypothetical protein
MRITTLVLLLGAVAAPAHASPSQAALASRIATLSVPLHHGRDLAVTAVPTVERGAAIPGDLGLTGARGVRKAAFLEADEIAAAVAPIGPDVEHCFVAGARRAGHLDLTLLIARDGGVISLRASAAGLTSEGARRVEACIGAAIRSLRFPARRNDTTAVIPYYFQRTVARNAGPQLSCWNPRGC